MNDDELERMAQGMESGDFARRARTLDDFLYDPTQNGYWDLPSGVLWSANSVDGAVPLDQWPTTQNNKGEVTPQRPSAHINRIEHGRTVDGSTWWPGEPQIIRDRIASQEGIRRLPGAQILNHYTPADPVGEPGDPTPWIEHVRRIYPEEAEHLFDWCAYTLQNPGRKINHGIVLAGEQGIGKDALLTPLRWGVGDHNTREVGADKVLEPYNPWVKSVLLVINEVKPREIGHKAAQFQEALKPLLAAPPDVLALSEKYQRTLYVPNITHVVMTTNDALGMFLDSGDRRVFVAQSPANRLSDAAAHELWEALRGGAAAGAIQWLLDRDVSHFAARTPPPMTAAKQQIIDAGRAVRWGIADDVLADFLEFMGGSPSAFFTTDLQHFINAANFFDDKQEAIKAVQKNNFHYIADRFGYRMMRNGNGSKWKNGSFQSRGAYVRKTLTDDQQMPAVEAALKRRPLSFKEPPEASGDVVRFPQRGDDE
ncbi:MAG: hypothetical protein FKY71_16325 [Spiribacter salinus]|uniref:NrS-1 polymerase-like helicase domain-containing protein n=1 Tax=Spiribacter salinus TaxID=1335746 RepID=A0A540VLS7_9GAMM|nr:MAG: hypothetical protein FKY71_16325 [Spiribacter salinus]